MAHTRSLPLAPKSPIDLEMYLEADEDNESWQDELDALLHDLHIDPQTLPSIDELRDMVSRYIPYEDSLSDAVIAMREE